MAHGECFILFKELLLLLYPGTGDNYVCHIVNDPSLAVFSRPVNIEVVRSALQLMTYTYMDTVYKYYQFNLTVTWDEEYNDCKLYVILCHLIAACMEICCCACRLSQWTHLDDFDSFIGGLPKLYTSSNPGHNKVLIADIFCMKSETYIMHSV